MLLQILTDRQQRTIECTANIHYRPCYRYEAGDLCDIGEPITNQGWVAKEQQSYTGEGCGEDGYCEIGNFYLQCQLPIHEYRYFAFIN
jgi:hypothetical protein